MECVSGVSKKNWLKNCRKFDDFFAASEAAFRRYSTKWVFFKISQNSQENTCASVSIWVKLQAGDLFTKHPRGTASSNNCCDHLYSGFLHLPVTTFSVLSPYVIITYLPYLLVFSCEKVKGRKTNLIFT